MPRPAIAINRLKKLAISAVIVGVLALQIWVMIPSTHRGGWYWPFLSYPMYSVAHHASDSVEILRLALATCSAPDRFFPVPDSLGIPKLSFPELLKAVDNGSSAATATLDADILSRYSRACRGRILVRSVLVGTYNWTDSLPAPIVGREWSVR